MSGDNTQLSAAADATLRVELSKMLATVDQGITAHSNLRDRFSRAATALSLFLIVASAIVTFLAIASDAVKTYVLSSTLVADHFMGAISFLILLGAIGELQLGWREKSGRHSEAANALARLKFLMRREMSSSDALESAKYAELQQAYENVNDLIAKIPEGKFLKLKAVHRRKVEMSRFLDLHPGASILGLRIKIWLRDNMVWPKQK
jgi:hypothetical protein